MRNSAPRMVNDYNEDQLALADLLSQPNGFERYAAEKMPEFIQVQRDYEGFVRDVIMVTTVSPEDLVRVDEEVFVSYALDLPGKALALARNGEIPTMQVEAKTIKVTFDIYSTPRITITQFELDTQPYDLMKRAQEKSGQELAKIEDTQFLMLANMLIDGNKSQHIDSLNTSLTKGDLLAIKNKFDMNDVAFAGYLMNPSRYNDFLLWGENDLDDATQRTVLETGKIPTIWGGVQMITGLLIPVDIIYGLAPKEILGRMPILRDVTLEVNKIPQTQDKEIMAYEYLGMFIHSHLTIARLKLKSA